jgi:hypothetical protein
MTLIFLGILPSCNDLQEHIVYIWGFFIFFLQNMVNSVYFLKNHLLHSPTFSFHEVAKVLGEKNISMYGSYTYPRRSSRVCDSLRFGGYSFTFKTLSPSQHFE